MPEKTKKGYISPKPDDYDYIVNGTRPSGVFVQNIRGTVPSLEYAGTGNNTGEGFTLPKDPDFLRDIAAGILAAADDIENDT